MARSRKLANLVVNETSGVDHPAHLHEGWLVIKNAAEPTDPDTEGADDVELNVSEVEEQAPVAASVEAPDVELRKEMTNLRKELEAMRVEKEALEAERSLEKAVEAAEAWASIPGVNAAEFGAVLLSLRKSAPTETAVVEEILTAAARTISEAGILEETGVSGAPEATDAWGTIKARAQELVNAGEANTIEKAVTIVATRDMDLYNQYLSEKGI